MTPYKRAGISVTINPDDKSADQNLTITVVVDNETLLPELHTEHGLALCVKTPQGSLLMDTGQGAVLPHNAAALVLDPKELTTVVISHGHYDHTGGLVHIVDAALQPIDLYAHPAAFQSHWKQNAEPPHKDIGMPTAVRDALQSANVNIIETTEPREIFNNLWVTGAIPRVHPLEDTGGAFFLDKDCSQTDRIEDDQAIWIHSSKGIVVLFGCAHAGVINTLDYIADLTQERSFHAVIGGMHLHQAREERIDQTSAALKAYGVEVAAPCHCTGAEAIARLRDKLGDVIQPCAAGSVFTFPALI